MQIMTIRNRKTSKTHVFTLCFCTPGARQKALQDASKMPSGRPKKRPRAPKKRFKRSRGLGCPHKAPKRLPRRPKEAPKRHPRGPQEALKALKIVAKRLTNQIRFSLSRNDSTFFAVVFDSFTMIFNKSFEALPGLSHTPADGVSNFPGIRH